jgi:hypothetical protein
MDTEEYVLEWNCTLADAIQFTGMAHVIFYHSPKC